MAVKLGEYLSDLGVGTRTRMDQRARAGATGYELFDITVGLGSAALMGTGRWIGVNEGPSITISGDPVEVDSDHPLTQIALQAATSVGALNDLITVMDGGNTGFSPAKHEYARICLQSIAYTVGRRILNTLDQEQE